MFPPFSRWQARPSVLGDPDVTETRDRRWWIRLTSRAFSRPVILIDVQLLGPANVSASSPCGWRPHACHAVTDTFHGETLDVRWIT
jgi:hypothetical protein